MQYAIYIYVLFYYFYVVSFLNRNIHLKTMRTRKLKCTLDYNIQLTWTRVELGNWVVFVLYFFEIHANR